MKKISALLAIVMLLSAFVFAFSSCAPGINVNSVKDDPAKFLNEAMNKSTSEFFKDDTGIIEIIAQALNEGSVKLSADLTQLAGTNAKLDMSIYNENNAKKQALILDATFGDTNSTHKFFSDEKGNFIIQSEELFGSAQAYLLNLGTLVEGFDDSAFGALSGEAAAEVKAMLKEYADMLDEIKNSTVDKANASAKKLYEALNYETNDAGENVALVMKINNQTIKEFFNIFLDEYPISESEKELLKEEFSEEIFDMIDEAMTIDIEIVFMIRKNNGALEKMDLRGEMTADGMTVNVNGGFSVTADKMTIFANASTEFGSTETTIFDLKIESVKAKEGATVTYTTTAAIISGNATFNVGTLKFEHNKDNGKYQLTISVAKELVATLNNLDITVSGTAKKEGGKATITLSEINIPEELGGTKLELDISAIFDKDAKLPDAPADAKDIVTLTEAEINAIFENISKLFPQPDFDYDVVPY